MYARLYLGIEVKSHLICFRLEVVKEEKWSGCSRRATAAKKTTTGAPAWKEGDSGIQLHYFPSTTKERFRHTYYSAIDVTIECIRTKFNQKDFKVYQSIQELLLKAVAGKDHEKELVKVMAVYGDNDLQQYKLETQLSLLPDMVRSMGYNTSWFDIADLLDFFQSRGNARIYFPCNRTMDIPWSTMV